MRAMAKSGKQSASVVRVGINGFGRVGRCVARALSTQAGDGLRLVAINSPSGAQIGAHLLRHDSTHGIFAAEVEAVGDSIKIDGRENSVHDRARYSVAALAGRRCRARMQRAV